MSAHQLVMKDYHTQKTSIVISSDIGPPLGLNSIQAGPDSGVRTFHWNSQWKVRTSESGPARVPEMPPGYV